MPKKLPTSGPSAADRAAALVRIYLAAIRANDLILRDAAAEELKKYGLDLTKRGEKNDPRRNRSIGRRNRQSIGGSYGLYFRRNRRCSRRGPVAGMFGADDRASR
jgi:hypothetical protein